VADARQGDADQAVEELVHAPAAQGHPATDRVALAEPEAADRLLGLGDLGLLAGDLGKLLGRLVEPGLVLQRLAHAHVDDDLLQPRQAELVGPAQLLREAGHDLFLVAFLQPGHDEPRSILPGTRRRANLVSAPLALWESSRLAPRVGAALAE